MGYTKRIFALFRAKIVCGFTIFHLPFLLLLINHLYICCRLVTAILLKLSLFLLLCIERVFNGELKWTQIGAVADLVVMRLEENVEFGGRIQRKLYIVVPQVLRKSILTVNIVYFFLLR